MPSQAKVLHDGSFKTKNRLLVCLLPKARPAILVLTSRAKPTATGTGSQESDFLILMPKTIYFPKNVVNGHESSGLSVTSTPAV